MSTTPHLEHRIHLTVIQPVTAILGPPERYIKKGSTINLTCIIKAGPLNLNPSYVFWNYNGKIITYDRERGGTVVISEKREQTTSSLIITHATSKDSGQYECDPSASYPQHVNVHVIKRGLDLFLFSKVYSDLNDCSGDPSDAVRRSSSGSRLSSKSSAVQVLLLLAVLKAL